MALTLVPVLSATADVQIQQGADILQSGPNLSGTQVVFGHFGGSPITWYVVEESTGTVTLWTTTNMGPRRYDPSSHNDWSGSEIAIWLNGEGTFSADGFLPNAFSPAESTAIATYGETEVTEFGVTININQRIVLPSYAEVRDDGVWELEMQDRGFGGFWWLRSPGYYSTRAAAVNYDGYLGVNGGDVDSGNGGVRPAFRLNPESVIFTSAAEGGKSLATVGSGLVAAEPPTDVPVKLTVYYSGLTLNVHETSTRVVQVGDTVSIPYSGATLGQNRFVSSVIVDDDDNVLYYGKLVDISSINASGTASFTVPSTLAPGNYTIRLFSEEANGDNHTDFASTPIDIPMTVVVPATVTVVGGTSNVATAVAGDTVTITANPPPSGQQFVRWDISPAVTFVSGNINTPQAQFIMPAGAVTATAVFEPIPASVHLITVRHTGNGVANASLRSASQGSQITLTATPDRGWQFKEWQVVSGGITLSGTTTATATFTMPNNAVEVLAVFEESRPGPPTPTPTPDNGSPITGDENNIATWLLLSGLSMLMMSTILLWKNRKWARR